MAWIKLTRPDGGPVWLNSEAEFWGMVQSSEGIQLSSGRRSPAVTTLYYGDQQESVLETPEQIIERF